MVFSPNSRTQVPNLFTPLADLFMRWKQLDASDDQDGDDRDPLKEQACESVWLLRRFYQEATDNDFAEGLLRQFTVLFPSGEKTAQFFKAWMDLLETLCQGAERQYGTKKGLGPYKAQQVKAVMLHLIFDGEEEFDIPGIPNFLEPLIVEKLVELSIDTIVKMLNQDKDVLWQPAPLGPIPRPQIFAGIISGIHRFGKWLMKLAPVVRFGEWVREWSRWALLKANPLPRNTEEEVRQILRTQPAISDVLKRVEKVAGWLVQHKDNVVALIELVSVAVQDAERFIELPGRDKKIYARNMVICFLEEYDIIQSSIARMITEWILDWAIDSVVNIFHKREVFQHRHTASA